jgi:hypothetical protein
MLIHDRWAASMALAFGLVARNPYQSFSQKVSLFCYRDKMSPRQNVKAHVIARAGTYVGPGYAKLSSHSTRMIADKTGLTVGVLVASALVAGTTSKEANEVERVDHSWEDILGKCSSSIRGQKG